MLRVTLYLPKKFQKLPASCGGTLVMTIACHAGDSGSIPLVGAYHSVRFTLFYLSKKKEILNLTVTFFGRKLLVP